MSFLRSFLFLALAAAAMADTARPNILWLIAEDFGPHLGCYGTKEVHTPVLDSLAAQGTRFTRFYTTAPVCSASRSAFGTGMYQTTIGAHNHRSHRDDGYILPKGVRVISDRLREAGYFTANLKQLPPAVGFKGSGKTDWNFMHSGSPFDSDRWPDLKTHQPFYAQINFQETHRAFQAPKHADPAKADIPPYYPDHPVTREDWAKYLDSATELDRKIGKIIDQLKRDGLFDHTIICFFGDNGAAHVRGKQFCYEEGLQVPCILHWPAALPVPKGLERGAVSDRLLMSIDLTATTLAWAGVSKPAGMQGQVFAGSNAEPPRQFVFGARDRCDETVFRLRTVRDERYRFIRNFTAGQPFLAPNAYKEKQYPVWNLIKELAAQDKLTPAQAFLAAPTMPEEELYDLESDPHQIHNLIASTQPEHQAARERLRQALTDWIAESGDQGRVPEPDEVVQRKGLTKPGPATNPDAPAGATRTKRKKSKG